MGKHADKVGSFENFRAPWETEAGADAEIDKPKLKRLIFNLKAGEAKALDSVDEAKDAVTKAEADLEEAKSAAADANGPETTKKIAALEKKVSDLTTERDNLVAAKEQADLRAEVLAGLDPKYAKYVTGTTQEELEKSLEDVKKDFGLEDGDGDDEDPEEDEPTVRTTPRSRVRNPADPQGGKGGEVPVDFDKVADEYLGNSVFH